MPVTLDELIVADTPASWVAAGFTVDEDAFCRVGGVRVRLVGRDRGTGIVGWSLGDLPEGHGDLDGIATVGSQAAPGVPALHPNGVIGIDHAVLLSPDLTRTVSSLEAIGVLPRRERDGELGGSPMRQIFFRLGEVILEVVGSPGATSEEPSSLWGVTFVVADIDATAALLGERTSPVKDAVQPGRRITTLRHREFDISVRTALISAPIRKA